RHIRADLTRTHGQHAHPSAAQRLAEQAVEAIRAGLRGAVHKVRTAHHLTRYGGEGDDLAVALLLHLLTQQHTDGHRAGEVNLCGLHGQLLVLPLLLVIAQDSERDDRDVDIAGLEGLVDDRRVRIEIHGIEWQGLHLGCTGSLAAADGFVQALTVAGSEHHARRATGQELFDYGQAHVGRTAEQQDGLWLSNSINHEITPLKGSSVFSAARG